MNLVKKYISIFLAIVTLTFTGIFAGYLTSSFISYYQGYKRVSYLAQDNIYMGNDQITDSQYQKIDNIHNKDKAKKIFKYIEKNYRYSIYWDSGNDKVNAITANTNFLDLYHIKVKNGRVFNQHDTNAKKAIPVIVGYKLRKKYPLGKEFKYFNSSNNKVENHIVVGILYPNTSVPSVYLFQSKFDLDNVVIANLTNETKKNINLAQLADSSQNLALLDTSKNKADELQNKFSKNNLNVKFYSAESNINDEINSVKRSLIRFLVCYLVAFIVTVICAYSILNYKYIYSLSVILVIIIEAVLGMNQSIFSISYSARSSALNWSLTILVIVISWRIIFCIAKVLQRFLRQSS